MRKIVPKQGAWIRQDPSNTVLTLDEMKLFCYVDTEITDDDALFSRMELAARNICEQFLGRPLLTATQTLYYNSVDVQTLLDDNVPLDLPSGKLQAVSSIQVFDSTGVATVIAPSTYEVSTVGEQGQVYFKESPLSVVTSYRHLDTIAIDVIAGFGDTVVDVPDELTQGMLFLIANWYEHREDQQIGNAITSSAKASWSPWKMQRFRV
jgi:uncharacterized phiE125 gp8 family phage protein